MKYIANRFTFLFLFILISASVAVGQVADSTKNTSRMERAREKYEKLFGRKPGIDSTDPELMNIMRKFIYGDVFYTGVLSDKERELITIVTLVTQQTLSQLKKHTQAALNIGVTPIEIREAVYQCAPYIGYPKTLNAVNAINEVFKERGIALPLENMGTVTEQNRFEKGKAIQYSLYGDEIEEMMKTLPGDFKEYVPRFLTEADFGDFYTRDGLDIKTRELLMYCVLATMGAKFQLKAHVSGSIKAGNSYKELIAAMVHCIGYIGFPKAINAIIIIKNQMTK